MSLTCIAQCTGALSALPKGGSCPAPAPCPACKPVQGVPARTAATAVAVVAPSCPVVAGSQMILAPTLRELAANHPAPHASHYLSSTVPDSALPKVKMHMASDPWITWTNKNAHNDCTRCVPKRLPSARLIVLLFFFSLLVCCTRLSSPCLA